MEFLLPSLLTIGLPLIALPPLIHLINLRRRRRVPWAAMDFLLQSQKRNKRWILLKQLLLMLIRTAAVALAVLMLAGPVLQSGWGALFGRGTTHHLILLDDSYSMSDQAQATPVLDRGKEAIRQVLQQARGRSSQQSVTIILFSQADDLSAGAELSFDARSLDAEAIDDVDQFLQRLAPSETAAGPVEAMEVASRLPKATSDETRIVYLVSDFRQPQWTETSQLQQLAQRLREQSDQLQLIQCVQQARENLAVTMLAPQSGLRAAGVESWFDLTVFNYGDEDAVGVTVAIEQDGRKLPAVEFDQIASGDEATRRFRAAFPEPGGHQLSARLESDAVEIDNVRYFAAQIPRSFPVLIVDGSTDGDDGYYLRNALSPGGQDLAGWSPQVETPSYLRQSADLRKFAAIFLLDVPRLEQPAVDALESYVAGGGGLAIFVGPNVQRTFYNERLYRDGEGLLPVELDVPTQLVRNFDAAVADVRVTPHPVFRVFQGQRNSFLASVDVEFYYDVESDKDRAAGASVIASLRNGAPLVLEKRRGDGRVLVQLCKLSPRPTNLGVWSNLAVNPVFPVYANELTGYLSANRRRFEVLEVGADVATAVPESEYQPEAKIRLPRSLGGEQLAVTAKAEDAAYRFAAPKSRVSGVWEFELARRDELSETRYVAVNVAGGEGDLHFLGREDLEQRLPEVEVTYSFAGDLASGDQRLAGFNLSDALLYGLIIALVLEQWLAFSASYHGRYARGRA